MLFLLIVGVAATLGAAYSARLEEAGAGGEQALATTGLAAIGVLAGFRCGRMMVSGALSARRRCDSCGARRQGTGAFCESCGWRD
jgi:hypothetical protein